MTEATASETPVAADPPAPEEVDVSEDDLNEGDRAYAASLTPPPPSSKRLPPLPLASKAPPKPRKRADSQPPDVMPAPAPELAAPIRTSQFATLTSAPVEKRRLPLVAIIAAFVVGIGAGGWFLGHSRSAPTQAGAATRAPSTEPAKTVVLPPQEEHPSEPADPTPSAAAAAASREAPREAPPPSAAPATSAATAEATPPPASAAEAPLPAPATAEAVPASVVAEPPKAGGGAPTARPGAPHRPPASHSTPNSGYKPGGI